MRSTDANQCTASNVTFTVTATDNCPGVSTVCAPPSGSTFPKGVTAVNCVATDAAGNTNKCSFTVTVNDIGATVITSPASFPVGTTTVSCTASNAAGTASCSFIVTVQDTEPPLITCPGPLAVQCDTDVPAFNLALVKATDNCDSAPVVAHVSDISTGTCPKIITRTYKATDAAGNAATCTQTITVHDTIAPVISGCLNLQVGRRIHHALSPNQQRADWQAVDVDCQARMETISKVLMSLR